VYERFTRVRMKLCALMLMLYELAHCFWMYEGPYWDTVIIMYMYDQNAVVFCCLLLTLLIMRCAFFLGV